MQHIRLTIIDLLKAIAAQLIVLHHMFAYGPLAAALDKALPTLSDWLYNDARIAVQVFLVTGGYLAARSLTRLNTMPWHQIARRYVRLTIPFMAAVLLAVLCAALVRPGLADDMVPAAPTLAQLAAHAFLLQGILGQPALSAGIWYVAIDFQLFALFAILLWLCRLGKTPHIPPIIAFTLLGLFVFNLNPDLDNYAVYFFGAYGLGVLSFYLGQWPRRAIVGELVIVLAGGLACWYEWRTRTALATLTALLLITTRRLKFSDDHIGIRLAEYFNLNAYALFLIHFPILLLGNWLFLHFGLQDYALGFALLLWLLANLAADVFFRYVERPAFKVV